MAQTIGGIMVQKLIQQCEMEQRLLDKKREWERQQEAKREEVEEYER